MFTGHSRRRCPPVYLCGGSPGQGGSVVFVRRDGTGCGGVLAVGRDGTGRGGVLTNLSQVFSSYQFFGSSLPYRLLLCSSIWENTCFLHLIDLSMYGVLEIRREKP
jgi:hypothetical protein